MKESGGDMQTHAEVTDNLKTLLEGDSSLKMLVEKSIRLAAELNPNPETNPVRSLDQLYDFIDFTLTTMPWSFLPEKNYSKFVTKTDQSCLYIYFLLDRPLPELEGKLPMWPAVEYLPEIYSWLKDYNNALKVFMDSEASWKEEYLKALYADPTWHLDQGWYEDSSSWHSFNDFFSRKFLDVEKARPLDGPDDDTVVTSPGDSLPQGTWQILEDGNIFQGDVLDEHGVVIKTSTYYTVRDILGEEGAAYEKDFYGGTLTHTFYNFDDYHRFHAPVSGRILAAYLVKDADAVGGITTYEPDRGLYVLESNFLGWQAYETRGCVILQTENYGLCAVQAVGQGQVSSVHFSEGIEVGTVVRKGEELGYFLFGGSDCVMIFSREAGFEITAPRAAVDDSYANGYAKILCRTEYGRFHGNKET